MLNRRLLLVAGGLAWSGVGARDTGEAGHAGDMAGFWSLLREGGKVILMRHAQTEPGIGDPPGWRLNDCRTQRNLSDDGREQARRVGEAFRRERVRLDEVRSSAWCRCVDTAQIAFGRHTVWPAINSFFQRDGAREQQTREVMAAVRELRGPGNWVLVTHQVNVTGLTGEVLSMGEVLVTRPDIRGRGLRVLARQVF